MRVLFCHFLLNQCEWNFGSLRWTVSRIRRKEKTKSASLLKGVQEHSYNYWAIINLVLFFACVSPVCLNRIKWKLHRNSVVRVCSRFFRQFCCCCKFTIADVKSERKKKNNNERKRRKEMAKVRGKSVWLKFFISNIRLKRNSRSEKILIEYSIKFHRISLFANRTELE